MALSAHLFYGDVDGDGKLDIGMLPEQILCKSVYDEVEEIDRPHRARSYGSLQWYSQFSDGPDTERWIPNRASEGQCPLGGLGYINPPGADGTAIDQALKHRPELDSQDMTIPYCAERAMERRQLQRPSGAQD